MSEFHVEVVRLGKIEKHPNADTLSITRVRGDYPVVIRTGEFQEGQLAVYVPIDSVVPDTEQWSFLKGHRRIKAKRLRGIFSMGMLAGLPSSQAQTDEGYFIHWDEGMNAQKAMGIEKWEPIVHQGRLSYAENESDQSFMPKYTDIEGFRRYSNLLKEGENVAVTEKVHGANGRWLYRDGRFWVGSHNYLKKEDQTDTWWRVLDSSGLRKKLSQAENMLFFGEVLGVQDLKYGLKPGELSVLMFDIFDTTSMRYLNYLDFREICERLDIAVVPPLYLGPWGDEVRSAAEGKTTVGGDHVREGFVVRPLVERWDDHVGRVILKLVGEGYLLRKEG